jgi:hypothetical protein
MPTTYPSAADPGGKPSDILQFTEAGLAIIPRGDLGAVELRARDRAGPISILLGQPQAMLVAAQIIAAVALIDREEDRS